MSLSRCGRLARLSLAGARPVAAAAPRAFVARSAPLVRGVSSSSRDAQHKVRIEPMGVWSINYTMLITSPASRFLVEGLRSRCVQHPGEGTSCNRAR